MIFWEFCKKVRNRLIRIVKGAPVLPNLLEMVWPVEPGRQLDDISVPPGYLLRQFAATDTQSYYDLFAAAGMEKPPLHYWRPHLLPNGFFVIEHLADQHLVAAGFASHHPTDKHEQAGNLGWLAVHPAHRGRHLGQVISTAITARLLQSGYQRIYLETHDHRLPALAIYLKMGWLPLLYLPEMRQRWMAVCKNLNWPYTPERWPE